mgnify:CR=1 FL=1
MILITIVVICASVVNYQRNPFVIRFNSKSKKFVDIQEEVEQINYELTGTDIIARLILLNKNKPNNRR